MAPRVPSRELDQPRRRNDRPQAVANHEANLDGKDRRDRQARCANEVREQVKQAVRARQPKLSGRERGGDPQGEGYLDGLKRHSLRFADAAPIPPARACLAGVPGGRQAWTGLSDAALACFPDGLEVRRVVEAKPGKHNALNAALATVTTPLVVTVDADTYLQREALTRLVARIADAPQDQHTCACAGALVAANPHANYVTRMQEWDYRLGINGVKRMQAGYNSALVAQGAFSGLLDGRPSGRRRLAGRDR